MLLLEANIGASTGLIGVAGEVSACTFTNCYARMTGSKGTGLVGTAYRNCSFKNCYSASTRPIIGPITHDMQNLILAGWERNVL